MLKLKEDGYVYVSDRGIEYELLEGMSIGANKRYTSDIIFIILNNAEYNVEDHIVGYLFGASVLERQLMDYDESIKLTEKRYHYNTLNKQYQLYELPCRGCRYNRRHRPFRQPSYPLRRRAFAESVQNRLLKNGKSCQGENDPSDTGAR